MEFYQPSLRFEGRLCLFHNSQLHCGIICFLCHKSEVRVQRANTNCLSAQEALMKLRRKLTTCAHVDNRERVPQMPRSVPSDHGVPKGSSPYLKLQPSLFKFLAPFPAFTVLLSIYLSLLKHDIFLILFLTHLLLQNKGARRQDSCPLSSLLLPDHSQVCCSN